MGCNSWANRQHLRLRARPLEVGLGYGRRLPPSCPRSFASATCTTPATAPSPRAHPCSLSVQASSIRSWKSPHQIRLALSQGCRKHRACHRGDPFHRQLLIEECPSMHLPYDAQNTGCHFDTYLGQHCTDISHARSVLAQESAITAHPYRGQPSLGSMERLVMGYSCSITSDTSKLKHISIRRRF